MKEKIKVLRGFRPSCFLGPPIKIYPEHEFDQAQRDINNLRKEGTGLIYQLDDYDIGGGYEWQEPTPIFGSYHVANFKPCIVIYIDWVGLKRSAVAYYDGKKWRRFQSMRRVRRVVWFRRIDFPEKITTTI